MDKRAVMDALDEAIVNVAEAELNRISTGLSPDAITRNIENALRSLESLQQGHQPDCNDPWVALFYLLWYQPKQINLTYSMIKATADRHPPKGIPLNDSGKLLVVDVGCGSLAMQFGIMLAVADAFERGQFVSSIHIDSFDTSQAMISLGEATWNEFKKHVTHLRLRESIQKLFVAIYRLPDRAFKKNANEADGLHSISLSLEAITPSTRTSAQPLAGSEESENCWLSAIHAVYESNKYDLSRILKHYRDQLNPNLGFITTHRQKRDENFYASPFEYDKRYNRVNVNIQPQFAGKLPQTTRWRQKLSSDIRRNGINGGRIGRYLNNPVDWKWPDAIGLVYAASDEGEMVEQRRFVKGELVRHSWFGEGFILEISPSNGDEILAIEFANGRVRKFLKGKTPLEVCRAEEEDV